MKNFRLSGILPFVALCLLSFTSCRDAHRGMQESPDAPVEAEGISFAFASDTGSEEALDLSSLRGAWEDATINTGDRDRVTSVRLLCPQDQYNRLWSIPDAEKADPLWSYPKDIPVGESRTFYIIANEAPGDGFASVTDPESSPVAVSRFFTADTVASHNLMCAKYTVKRSSGSKYEYKREYPAPESGFTEATLLTRPDGTRRLAARILLFPVYSRFSVSLELGQVTVADSGQDLGFVFEQFPKQKMLFSSQGASTGGDTESAHTLTLDLKKHIEEVQRDPSAASKSYYFYFPATDRGTEKVYLSYTFEGKEHRLAVQPKSSTTFRINTRYNLPLKVNLNMQYDVCYEDIKFFRREEALGSGEEYKSLGGNAFIMRGGKRATIHVGVAHNYKTHVVVKSKMAPSELRVTDETKEQDGNPTWLTISKEDLSKREIVFEGDIPYYLQHFTLSYDLDAGTGDPLVTVLTAINTADPEKRADCAVSYNVLSKLASLNSGLLNQFVNGKSTEEEFFTFDPALSYDQQVAAVRERMRSEGMKMEGGVLYQWGRNAPLDPTRSANAFNNSKQPFSRALNEATPTSLGVIWMRATNKYFYPLTTHQLSATAADQDKMREVIGASVSTVYTWYCWVEKREDQSTRQFYIDVPSEVATWSRMIDYQRERSRDASGRVTMPDYYYGNNGGDPCPRGYKLPTREDLLPIVYNAVFREDQSSVSYNYFKKRLSFAQVGLGATRRVTEINMNLSGDPRREAANRAKQYDALYYKPSTDVVYATRFAESGAAPGNKGAYYSLFRYREVSDGFFIDCIPLRRKYHSMSMDQLIALDLFSPSSEVSQARGETPEQIYDRDLSYALIAFRFFPKNRQTSAKGNLGTLRSVDVWSASTLWVMSTLDADLTMSSSKYTAPHAAALVLRCIQD